MEFLLLMVDNKRDRRTLIEWLENHYQLVSGESENPLEHPFDLAIVDGPALKRFRSKVLARRQADMPVMLPFLLLAGRRKGARPVRHLGALVDDLIMRPFERDELLARVANLLRLRHLSVELKREHDRVTKLSVTDDVSGFYNTRYLHRFLDRRLNAPKSRPEPISLVFFDLDNFKNVVDTHGHLLGAKVLKEVAQTVARVLDPDDRLVRYGGDEYIVILPHHNKTEAMGKVTRIMQAITSASYLEKENLSIRVTASFGLASYPEDAHDKRELLAAADRCLFRSKTEGKDRISVAGLQECHTAAA